MALVVHTRNLTISCFTSSHRKTSNWKSSKSYQILSQREIFNRAKVEYEDALKNSGYNVELKYINSKSEKPKTRIRNIIWFKPPFSKSVSTNVARTFFHLVTKHFRKKPETLLNFQPQYS